MTFTIKGKYTSAEVLIDMVDQETIKQINSMVNHPAFTNPIKIMPDTHAGKGSVIGFTMPVSDKIIPNVIGVDVGCGMLTVELQGLKKEKLDLAKIDKCIRSFVPMGAGGYMKGYEYDLGIGIVSFRLRIRNELSKYRKTGGTRFNAAFNKALSMIESEDNFRKLFLERIGCPEGRFNESLGTLGGGNHFIEIGEFDGRYFVTVHTGSRQVGLKVANAFQKIAKESLEKSGEHFEFDLNDSAYLVGDSADEYLACMMIAQTYAKVNREIIMGNIIGNFPKEFGLLIPQIMSSYPWSECVHNFISPMDGIIRKGAISASEGEFLIIPLTPKDGIIIGFGKGNKDWNLSAPHGAGRVMSRSEAKRSISDEQASEAMSGVFASCKPKDESPLAYKDPVLIMEAVGGTMTIAGIIKPVLNIKAMDTDE